MQVIFTATGTVSGQFSAYVLYTDYSSSVTGTSTTGTAMTVYSTTANNLIDFQYSFPSSGSSSDLKLSWYVLKLDFQGSLIYTVDGGSSCTSSLNCLSGYMCSGGSCLQCDASCLDCTQDKSNSNSNLACSTKCNVHSSLWKSTPSSQQCALEYIDLSNFQAIQFDNTYTLTPPRTNRVTLSLWAFFSDLSTMSTSGAVTITVVDYLSITLTAASSSTVKAYCAVYNKLYPGAGQQTTKTTYTTWITNTSNIPSTAYTSMTIPASPQSTLVDMNGHWFQC